MVCMGRERNNGEKKHFLSRYFASQICKAHQYTDGGMQSRQGTSRIKCYIIVARVCLGRAYSTDRILCFDSDDRSVATNRPPSGYDSVVVSPGDKNYPDGDCTPHNQVHWEYVIFEQTIRT